MASTDMLTNVHNRRSLFDLGNKQFNIARRYQRPLTLIILDVDHFKNARSAQPVRHKTACRATEFWDDTGSILKF